MNTAELHQRAKDTLIKLQSGQLKKELAKEIFNGVGKIVNINKVGLEAIALGFPTDVPLCEITKEDAKKRIQERKK